MPDGRARATLDDVRALGAEGVESVGVSDLYFVRGDLTPAQIDLLCHGQNRGFPDGFGVHVYTFTFRGRIGIE